MMNPYVTSANLEENTAQWLRRIQLFNLHKMTLNPSASALLVVDMHRFFVVFLSSLIQRAEGTFTFSPTV